MLAPNRVRHPLVFVMVVALLGSLWGSAIGGLESQADEPKLEGLLQRSPSPANAVGYLHLPSLQQLRKDAQMRSEVAEKIEEVWIISSLDPIGLKPDWEAGYATLHRDISADELAKAVKGYVDQISGQDVVWSPKESYLVPLEEQRVGFLRPTNRSLLSAWLDKNISVNESAFLQEQAKQSESFLSLLVAIDLQHAFSPVPMAQKLADFKSLKSKSPETVASLLASIRGISVIVGRRSLNECILRVEFTKSPASLLPIANELLAELLERNQTSAAEVLTWKPKVDGNVLTFQGPITEGSLDGVLSIFSIRDHAEGVVQGVAFESSQESAAEQMGYMTKSYFDQVQGVIERVRDNHSQTTGSKAKWNDQQARRIEELGTLNVDPQLIDYATNVSDLLRNNALTIRSGNITAGQAKAQQGLSSGFSYGYGYGHIDPNTSSDYQRVTDAQARGAAYADYTTTQAKIDSLTAAVRRDMTAKYKIQF